jgi:hypothetical protein
MLKTPKGKSSWSKGDGHGNREYPETEMEKAYPETEIEKAYPESGV